MIQKTAKELLEAQDIDLDLEEFRYKPDCNLHPKADTYNMQYRALRYLALEKPTLAKDVYTYISEVDAGIEVSPTLIES